MNVKALNHTALQRNCKAQLFALGNQLKKEKLTIEDIGDLLPGSVMVQDLSTMTNLYMNKSGCEILKHSREELQALGPDYFTKFFPAAETAFFAAELTKFIATNNESGIYSFFQQARPDKNSDYQWYYTNSRVFGSSNLTAAKTIMHVSFAVSNLGFTQQKINRLMDENRLIEKNYYKFNLLTRREKEIIKLIAGGKSSSAISDMLFICKYTVDNHRKNILQKLDIKSLADLIKFALAFDLI